jgi:hypothetical protein
VKEPKRDEVTLYLEIGGWNNSRDDSDEPDHRQITLLCPFSTVQSFTPHKMP